MRAVVAIFTGLAAIATAQAGRAEGGDVGVAVGPMKRFMAQRIEGAQDAGLGWSVQARGHAKLGRSLRVGAFASYDKSPWAPATARHFIEAGPSVRFMPPLSTDLRIWVGVGLAYARAIAPGYSLEPPPSQSASAPKPFDVHRASGGFLEAPASVGIGYMLKRPWMIEAELSGRFAFAHHGELYDLDNGRSATMTQTGTNVVVENPGVDRWAIGLTLGLSLQL